MYKNLMFFAVLFKLRKKEGRRKVGYSSGWELGSKWQTLKTGICLLLSS